MVGPGLNLPHAGRHVVLHPECSFGRDVTLFHQVTVGGRNGSHPPAIGDGVLLGVGAKVLGAVTVGAGAAVGAGAVVVDSVPDGETWVGVPAQPVRTRRGQRVTGATRLRAVEEPQLAVSTADGLAADGLATG